MAKWTSILTFLYFLNAIHSSPKSYARINSPRFSDRNKENDRPWGGSEETFEKHQGISDSDMALLFEPEKLIFFSNQGRKFLFSIN